MYNKLILLVEGIRAVGGPSIGFIIGLYILGTNDPPVKRLAMQF